MVLTKKSINSILIAIALIVFGAIVFLRFDIFRYGAVPALTFLMNGTLFLWQIIKAQREHSYSIELIVWIFMFFFMFFSPLVQYGSGEYPWSDNLGTLSSAKVIRNNLIVFLFSVAFLVGSSIQRHRKKGKAQHASFLVREYQFSYSTVQLFFLLSLALTAYMLASNGFESIFAAREESGDKFYTGSFQSIRLIVNSFVPAFITYATVSAICYAKEHHKGYFVAFLQLLCLLICFFPTTIARYKAATIYVGVLLSVSSFIKKGSRFFWVWLFGLFIIFPLLNGFRYASTVDIGAFFSDLFDDFLMDYTEGHYDAYRMLSATIDYVAEYGVTWGRQLLGVALFFVPRSWWSSKPIGSGATIMEARNPDAFSNVSCPFIGECYINFGFVGLILGAFALGYFCTKWDRHYHSGSLKGPSSYLFLVSLIFFVMRGDLLSSFAYSAGFMATAWLMNQFAKAMKKAGFV